MSGAMLGVLADSPTTPVLSVQGTTSQTADLFQAKDSTGSSVFIVKSDGSLKPASLADASATNDSIYYSTTQNKLVYKDSSGVVNNLY
jgi:hypothetical protein